MLLSLKTFPYLHNPLSLTSFRSIRPRSFLPLRPISSSSSTSNMSLITTVEHIVLFKVRDSTDPSKTDAMIANLRSLASLNIATLLTAGPLLRRRSSDAFGFTHLLYSRFRSKPDLAAYAVHPSHLAVVQENVLPICDDLLAVDWVADVDADADAAFSPGSLLRLTLAKPREGTAGAEIVRAIDGVRASVPDSVRVSYGENFSPGRAKGYDVGFVSVFSGVDEADVIEGKEEVEKQKEKMRPLLESVIVVDYLVPSAASSL